jgi:hypothetical protein
MSIINLRPFKGYLTHFPDHEDFRRKLINFMSELWIDPEVCLILSVGEPGDFMVPTFKTLFASLLTAD